MPRAIVPKTKLAGKPKSSMPVKDACPFPKKIPFSVTYGDYWALNGGSGIKVQSFRLNSLYDPDVTGVGGKPTYADQLAQVYQSYLVTSADVTVEFFSFNTEIEMVGAIWHPSGESPVSSVTQIQQIALENSNAMYANLPGKGSTGNTPRIILKKHLDLSKLEGVSLDDNFRADFGSNPVNSMHLDVFSIDPLAADDQATVACVTIKYNGFAYGQSSNTYTD